MAHGRGGKRLGVSDFDLIVSGQRHGWSAVPGLASAGQQMLEEGECAARGQPANCARSRTPFVVVDIECEQGYMTYLEVMNMGTSLASDVRIEIDPPLESAIDTEVGKLKMLNEGIATLAPGKKLRTFFDMSFRRNEDRPDLPMNYVARVRCADEKPVV